MNVTTTSRPGEGFPLPFESKKLYIHTSIHFYQFISRFCSVITIRFRLVLSLLRIQELILFSLRKSKDQHNLLFRLWEVPDLFVSYSLSPERSRSNTYILLYRQRGPGPIRSYFFIAREVQVQYVLTSLSLERSRSNTF